MLTSYVAKIAQPSVWPLAFIPCGQDGSVDWLGEKVCASGPKMDRVLEKLVREGGEGGRQQHLPWLSPHPALHLNQVWGL